MDILIVAATLSEIKPFLDKCEVIAKAPSRFYSVNFAGNNIDFMITGVGMVHTSYFLGLTLQQTQYDVAVNAGICGSFSKNLKIGEVVNVYSDYFPEIGVEEGNGVKSIFEMGYHIPDEFPYTAGKLVNEFTSKGKFMHSLPKVTGVTLNTSHGIAESIRKFEQNHTVDVESMEGAAFLFACIREGIPCLQLRAVSNYVEPRNENNWNIPLAIENLNQALFKILEDIANLK